MQASPYDTGYPHHLQHHHGTGVYGPMSGFDSSGLKFHHGGYPEAATDAAAFYQNYVNSGVAATQDYAPREPPSYAESTTTPVSSSALFHPGFPHTSSADYYKVGGGGGGGVAVSVNDASLRQMEMVSDYHGLVRNPAMTENFLMKNEAVGGGGSCGDAVGGGGGHLLDYNATRYSNENLHQLHHQQRQHQNHHPHLQHPHQHAQHPKPQMQMSAELRPNECKLEPEAQQEYKPTHDLNITPTASLSNLQHHQQQTQAQDDHPELAQPPVSDAATEPQQCQSPCSDDASGDGTEVTPGSQETDANSATTETPQPAAAEGNNNAAVGDEQQAAKNSNEVKPTLSYIALIAKSILESPQRRLNLGSIYGWIEKNFPYYKNRGQGWRNSVRHNLSLNDCFIKAGRCEDGKGNYWAIHPANMQDFLRGDFRQRRRSRRRGRKKDCELGMYHHHHHHQQQQLTNGYLGASAGVAAAAAAAAAAAGSSLGMGGFPPSAATLSNIYSPYTDAERRAYRLDEALLRQSMNNPFLKWYHHQPSAYPPATSPSAAVNTGVYSGVGAVAGVGGVAGSTSQWPQTYPENNGQGVYPLNSSFSR